MTLQNAGALTWLLPLGGAIIVLYLLRMRRRDVRVPASFLWPGRTDEVRANALIQKLRFSWLLVLQLLALALVVFAIAKPQTQQRGLAGEITVIVLDASASMGATDIKPSRFEAARDLAASTIRSAKAGDRIALIEAGPTPRVVFPLSSDPSKQLRALGGVQRYDSECDMGEAMRLAAALVGAQQGARIVLLSDGCFDPIRNFSRGKAAVVFQQIGKGSRNLGITALGTAETPEGRQLYVGVKNYALKDLSGAITLFADGKAISSEKLTVTPSKAWGKTLTVPPTAKVFEAKLDAPEDELPADNYAVSLADPGSTLRVLLVSLADPFMERALVLDPRVTLDRAPSVPTDTSRYDIVVFDGVPQQPVKARGVVAFGPVASESPVTDQGSASNPRFVSAEKKPLLDGVDFNGIYIESSRKVKARSTAEVLAESSSGPLVVARTRADGRKDVYVSFEPLKSDFPLQVSFPIFIANCLDYLGGQQSANMLAVRAGTPFSVSAVSDLSVRDPEGTRTQVPINGGNSVVRAVRRVGVHTLSVDGKDKPVYAYLRSERESNIDPRRDIDLGGGKVLAQQVPVRFADFWRPMILLALLVLSGEWWLYARRS